jgi:hypothetical protein
MNVSMKATVKLAASALGLSLALPALAASGASLPQVMTEGGISWMSGGVGRSEAAAMKQEAGHYPLSMVFSAGKHNEYLADVHVVIKNKAGKIVLDNVSTGPIMLVRLPAGKYSVAAVDNGQTLRRTASVAAKGDTPLNFHWPHA